jgi:hypothetical protein
MDGGRCNRGGHMSTQPQEAVILLLNGILIGCVIFLVILTAAGFFDEEED